MNNTDLSRLSYKELQSLAVKCKIPGNIKKQLLLEILHYLKCGNNSEVTKILNEIKKNRKKRTKKLKIPKSEHLIISRPVETSNMERSYRGSRATETNRENMYSRELNSTLNHDYTSEPFFTDFTFYESPKEIPEELLRHRISLTNNVNEINRRSEIISLGQAAVMDGNIQHARRQNESHYAHQPQQPLLVQLLQAPVGADLLQINTNPIGNTDASSSSSTLTASEGVEQDIISNPNQENIGRTNNGFAIDNLALPASIDSNQVEGAFRLDSIPTRDPPLHCYEWVETSTFNQVCSPQLEGHLNSTALMPYREYEDHSFLNLDNTAGLVQSNVAQYTCDNSNLFTHGAAELENGDLMPDLPLVPIINSPERIPCPPNFSNTNGYDNTQNVSNNNRFSNSHYEAGYSNQAQTSHEYTITDGTGYQYAPGFYRELTTNESTVVVESYPLLDNEQAQPSRDGKFLMDSYWPRWSQTNQSTERAGGRSLENTLNLCTPNYVDLTKLNETCSVYSNKTPVMTLRRGLNSSMTALSAYVEKSGNGMLQNSATESSPQRYNYNASNWLLYAGGSVETTTITDRKTYDPILPTSYGIVSQHQPESIF